MLPNVGRLFDGKLPDSWVIFFDILQVNVIFRREHLVRCGEALVTCEFDESLRDYMLSCTEQRVFLRDDIMNESPFEVLSADMTSNQNIGQVCLVIRLAIDHVLSIQLVL